MVPFLAAGMRAETGVTDQAMAGRPIASAQQIHANPREGLTAPGCARAAGIR